MRLRGSGRLIYVGAGTSGRLAVQDGAELIPTFNWPADRLYYSLWPAVKTRCCDPRKGPKMSISQASRLVHQHRIGPADAVIAVAASGTTPFTLACMRNSKQRAG